MENNSGSFESLWIRSHVQKRLPWLCAVGMEELPKRLRRTDA